MRKISLVIAVLFSVLTTGCLTTDGMGPVPILEEVDFAKNLGGNVVSDYEDSDRFFPTSFDSESAEYKALVMEHTYGSYEEAYENLLLLPELSDLDTREEMAYFINYICESCIEAVQNTESHEELETARERNNEAMMNNAIRASKDSSFTPEFIIDPNAEKYNEAVNKITPMYSEEWALMSDLLTYFDGRDDDEVAWLINVRNGGFPRFLFDDFMPLIKKICREWYTSDACQQVQAIEDELMERVRRERPVAVPQWFVDERKREAEIVAEYNRQILSLFLKFVEPQLEKKKAQISLMIDADTRVDEIWNNGDYTKEYLAAKYATFGGVEAFFHMYYELLAIMGDVPLIRTPPTYEGLEFIY
ncbi:MAG: hypothetical protein K5930_08895 [Treponemataceae bacterium]|nr:hypothetical protein [Treponemataceae bacterium]